MTEILPIAGLEDVPLRVAFPHEAQSFTPWLSSNLHRLADAIGAPLTLMDARAVAKAQFVDLLARDERDGSVVVIENQLEPSDDAHLGQIMTYLAGVDARTVIWIAERFAEPHLSAVRWLNAKAQLNVFAVRVRVVRIGASALATLFEVIERPNGWERALRAVADEAVEPMEGFAGGFWALYLARFPDEAKCSRPVGERCRWRATLPKGIVVGQLIEPGGASVFLRGRNGVTLDDARTSLAPFADEIECQLGVPLLGERSALLAVKTLEIDVANRSNWPAVSDWVRGQAQAYDELLRQLFTKQAAAVSRG